MNANVPRKSTVRSSSRVRRNGVSGARRGSILVVVLVVLTILALGAYTFSESMIVEAQATSAYSREAQARAAADSGVELAASLLTQRYQQTPGSYYSNPEWFQGILVQNSDLARGRGRFSVVSPVESDTTGRSIRFGLVDESSKLNVNAIPKLISDKTAARTAFQYIPQMTPDVVDAILDWVDTDSTPRELGAESDVYASLGYKPKNGPIDSLDELLMVRGVTPLLLFGEDANRNGLLDPNENDGELSPPLDNADGMLDRGWSAYLSVNGREGNVMSDGTPRINVNGNALADIFDQVQPVLGEEAAKFIVAYRMAGSGSQATGQTGGSTGSGQGTGGGTGGAGGVQAVQAVGEQKGTNASSGSQPQAVQAVQEVKAQQGTGGTSAGASGTSASAAAGAVSSAATMSGQAPVTRGGINVAGGGQVTVNSLYDMVGVQVQININGTNTKLDSPWPNDASLRTTLPKMFDVLTTKSDKTIDGRINVNHASRELLMGLPNMTPSIVDQIISGQLNSPTAASDPNSNRTTNGWLLMDGIVDLATMRKLDPYLTARGDVYRMQSVGYFEKGGPSVRIEAVIDATIDPPAVIFARDLTDLGRAFSHQLLMTGFGPTQ